MKFIVSSSLLTKQLQQISGVLNSSNTLPILDNFLFELKGNELIVSASDLESTMRIKLSIEKSEKDGAFAIPAKILVDSLKTFPDQPLTFSINADNYAIELTTENGKFRLAGFDGAEFPKFKEIQSSSSLSIASGILFTAINKTIFATGNDDLRPVMSGVFFDLNSENITFAATDAHKLVRYRRTDIKSKKAASFIMPKKPLNLLKAISGSVTADVQISFNETNALFTIDNISLFTRLIDGKYPNYEAVIPKENPYKLVVDRQQFLGTAKRVSIFSNRANHQVRLKIVGNELTVSAEDLDFSNDASERLSCQYTGDNIEIGFNSRFLIEMLNNIDTEQVRMELSAPQRAGIVLPAENSDKNEELLMLVMPVMLNNN